ncbi:histidine kinase [Pontibacter ummariensis]|uniref:Histidine kinase n=1 Tax=Pontibacter ummariensis TaxID=1610492 RepID=A0A239FSF4_9BACT|nr:histidine kinase [Pontibacter ummariensis]PRY11966.1 histidine kinase [Pontibacter ummariensis]SNS59152.1 Histidine kinase [Pontibacter ummariensis]
MPKTFIYRQGYLLIHLLVFFGLLLLLCQPLAWDMQLPTAFWVKQSILFCLWIGLYYLNVQFLVPQLLFRNRAGWFIAAIFASFILLLSLSTLVDSWLDVHRLFHQAKSFGATEEVPANQLHPPHPIVTLSTLLLLGISTTISVVQKWQKDEAIRQRLEKQKVSTELSFLKAQINPHFFFNTLHSIYALTMINVDSAREALHTLSRMMRYVLYETQTGTTLLSKEIEFMQDYLNLMRLRLTEKVTVTFDKPSSLQDLQVAPMLFLPFVENAFKHGVSALVPSSIYIGIHQQGKKLELEVRNSLLPEKRVVLEESSGIGLANTCRRLDLLYPGEYALDVTEKTPENEYKVHLTLNLA